MWVDSSQGESLYFLKDLESRAPMVGSGAWVVVGEAYGLLDGYLDQFKDGEDGDDYIHTDRTRLKINNKTALRGLSTASGNRLIINEENEFGNGVGINASALEISADLVAIESQTLLPFQTDSVASNTFTYLAHGLFNGEVVYVYPELADGTTPSPIPSGDYYVLNATNDTFQLSENKTTPVASSGNVYLAIKETIEIDAKANISATGNIAYKALIATPADGQIEDGHWDVYHNPTNGNLRIYARAGNTLLEPEGPGLSVEVKNDTATTLNAGTPVHLTGYDPIAKVAKVVKADHADQATMPAFGLLKEAMAPGTKGYVVFLGRLEGLDTLSLPGRWGPPLRMKAEWSMLPLEAG
jgi:hypothetical protein